MSADRISNLRSLLQKSPRDARLLFGLALELEKQEQWQEVADTLRTYLSIADDEGNAWGRLGRALRNTGNDDESRQAYHKGIEVARAHGHPSMAAEYEEVLEDWN
jgi:Flp pilus assembly protein TadD